MSSVEECKARLAKAEQVESILQGLRDEVIPDILKHSVPVSFKKDFGLRGPIEELEPKSVAGLEFQFNINLRKIELSEEFRRGSFYQQVMNVSKDVKRDGYFSAYCVKLKSTLSSHVMTFIPAHKVAKIVAKAQYGAEHLNTPASFLNHVLEGQSDDFFRVSIASTDSSARLPSNVEFKKFVESIIVGPFLSPQPTVTKKRKQPAPPSILQAEVANLIKFKERKPDPLPGKEVALAVLQRFLERPQDGLFGFLKLSGNTFLGFLEGVRNTSDAGGSVVRQLAEIRLAQEDPMETDLVSKAQQLQKEQHICDFVSKCPRSEVKGFFLFVCFYYGLGPSNCLLDCADEVEQHVVGPLGPAARGLVAPVSSVHFDSLEPDALRKRIGALITAKAMLEEENDEVDADAAALGVLNLFRGCRQWAYKPRDPDKFIWCAQAFLRLCADPFIAPVARNLFVFELISDLCEDASGSRDVNKINLQRQLCAEYADARVRKISPKTGVFMPTPASMDLLLKLY